MLIGAMNHPAAPVVEEIEAIAAMGLDFIDLTLEPPVAASWRIDPHEIRAALERHKLPVVGHTARKCTAQPRPRPGMVNDRGRRYSGGTSQFTASTAGNALAPLPSRPR